MRLLHRPGFALLLASCVLPSFAAECWTIGNISGQSTRANDGYAVSHDGYSGKKFEIRLDGKNSSVTPANGLVCNQIAPRAVLCEAYNSSAATVMLWAIDVPQKKVFHSQFRSGFDASDGAAVFVGEILAPCR